ncbi:hypothetical protein [Parabacteroides sp. Marseille-P3160]|uniref:hypothetical protein n=1 Tax=Parabacteroides sp. Marseille-P3160 TaxID=1917887 RepID=UPI0009BB4380|nr:hypothetical protein [Parabacteroides sp. Marseille-P3160]
MTIAIINQLALTNLYQQIKHRWGGSLRLSLVLKLIKLVNQLLGGAVDRHVRSRVIRGGTDIGGEILLKNILIIL